MTISERLRALQQDRGLSARRALSSRRARVTAGVSALALGVVLLVGTGPDTAESHDSTAPALTGTSAATTARASYDKTSRQEEARVDRVKKPRLSWHRCRGDFSCATVTLPLDYDHPHGATTKVALLRSRARKAHKVGTLFLNPGGPGASGTDLATSAADIFPTAVLDRFDVVGFDPRGTGSSSNIRCFSSSAAEQRALAPIDGVAFPDSPTTTAAFLRADRALGQACSSTGQKLSVSMSTAQVARDLDVLRRAVGDPRLTYVGFSYGSYLGQVYANLFPDRTRALVLDGVVDPTGWQGSAATRNTPMWDRIGSAEGSQQALTTVLRRCGDAGPGRCGFAAYGDPVAGFARLAARLEAEPLPYADGQGGGYGYDELISDVLDDLYAVDGAKAVDRLLSDLSVLTEPTAGAAAQRQASRSLAASRHRPSAAGYDNSLDAFVAVSCTDSPQVDHLSSLPAQAARAEARVPYFGALWSWNALGCAADSFTASDEDAYRGTFTRRTRAPLLFVGDTYDPVTSLAAATRAAALAGNSALVSSDSWGHTAYGTSACVDDAVDGYLLTGRPPAAKVTRCVGDYQPYAAVVRRSVAQEPVSKRLAPSVR